jgi:hypothetical protein
VGLQKRIGATLLVGVGAISGRARCGQPWAHKARAALGAQRAAGRTLGRTRRGAVVGAQASQWVHKAPELWARKRALQWVCKV